MRGTAEGVKGHLLKVSPALWPKRLNSTRDRTREGWEGISWLFLKPDARLIPKTFGRRSRQGKSTALRLRRLGKMSWNTGLELSGGSLAR